MKSVIITGADGFVGSYTVQCFLDHGAKVLAVDIAPQPLRLQKHLNLEYLCADITDTETLKAAVSEKEYDTFIHLAWLGSAGPQRTDYTLQMQNALATVEVMKTAKAIGCSRFLCAGSIMEKEVAAVIQTQGSKPGMAYLYGIGKQTAHAMCKAVAAEIGIDLVWPMITNTYGVGELSPRFVNTTIRKIIRRKALQFTAGTQNYDFVYITDVARAFYLIAQKGKPFCEYMIGSSNAKPLREFILEMTEALDSSNLPSFGDVPFTGTNMPISAFSTADTENDTGFKAQVSFAEGTKLTMKWLKTLEENSND